MRPILPEPDPSGALVRRCEEPPCDRRVSNTRLAAVCNRSSTVRFTAVRLFYIDDSGAESTGHAVYSWIEMDIHDWSGSLRRWLDWRRRLQATHGVPIAAELHASQFIAGRGSLAADRKWHHFPPPLRHLIAEEALSVIGSVPTLSVGTVYRVTEARGRDFQRQRAQLYTALVDLLDRALGAAGDLGMLVMDGDGSDGSYVGAHRGLPLATRSIVEDPMFQHSHRSQWVQIADLVAWTGYQHVLRHPGKKFAWQWYRDYLLDKDALGGPQRL